MEYWGKEVLASLGLDADFWRQPIIPTSQRSNIPFIPYLGITPLANFSV
jgi:hypothetical protein